MADRAVSNPKVGHAKFYHRRKEHDLPPEYDWTVQKRLYCPSNLLKKTPDELSPPIETFKVKHELGYVFCHRGLYDRAAKVIENSIKAIRNGVEHGYFLHEMDAFVLGDLNLNNAFIAHDLLGKRVSENKDRWQDLSYDMIRMTQLGMRSVDADIPDWASTISMTSQQVPGLVGTTVAEQLEPQGVTVQMDLREDQLATAIAYHSYHVSKPFRQHTAQQGAHHAFVWKMFQSTFFKGYNLQFNTWDDLHKMIKEKSKGYGKNYFEVRHLHLLPPSIMVFYSDPFIERARATPPSQSHWGRDSYEHLREVMIRDIKTFINIGEHKFNFILEITHSGLGLGYDINTGVARNPLDGELLTVKKVIFNSRVDRAMIDASLLLRETYPHLIFSSCTRLPDVTLNGRDYKADWKTSKMTPWADGEEGLASKLRAMHGGLYPRSHIVVADDPMAEIAARTWIDENARGRLHRKDLLHMNYDRWLQQGGSAVVGAVSKLNSEFLPNRCEDSAKVINSWLADVSEPRAQGSTPSTSVQNLPLRGKSSNSKKQPDKIYTSGQVAILEAGEMTRFENNPFNQDRTVFQRDRTFVVDRTASKFQDESFVFDDPNTVEATFWGIAAYQAAYAGREAELKDILEKRRFDINADVAFYGTALAAAAEGGHLDIIKLLLDHGADTFVAGSSGTPLEVAARNDDQKVMQLLVRAMQTSVKYSSHRAETLGKALYNACLFQNSAIVRFLIDQGADVNFGAGGFYQTPLNIVCVTGHAAIVQILLDHHADVNDQLGSFFNPMNLACNFGQDHIVKLLLDNKANVRASGNIHPLDLACSVGCTAVVKLLLQAGAKPTSLWDADVPEIVSLMLAAGFKPRNRTTLPSQRHPEKLARHIWQKPLKSQPQPGTNATFYVVPPKLRSCGCPLCFIDQESQPSLFDQDLLSMSTVDPVSYTLKLLGFMPN